MDGMASGKKTPALFELIRDPATFGPAQGERSAPASAPPSPPPPAAPPPRAAAPEPEPPRSAPAPAQPPVREPERAAPAAGREEPQGPRVRGAATLLDPRQQVTVSVRGIYLGVAALLLVLLAVWWAGWMRGQTDAEGRAIGGLEVPEPAVAIQDPLREGVAAAPGGQGPSGGAAGPSAGARSGPPDPRKPGLNYLAVEGRLDFDSASRIAEFLTKNGVPSIVVGPGGKLVDRPVPEVNNPVFYTVIALTGITREEFRDRAPVRENLEAEVRRLGQIWKNEHRGRTDFTRTGWSKYNP